MSWSETCFKSPINKPNELGANDYRSTSLSLSVPSGSANIQIMLSSDEESDEEDFSTAPLGRARSAFHIPKKTNAKVAKSFEAPTPRVWQESQDRVWDADNSANKLRFFKKDCTHIKNGIFVSGRVIANNRQVLQEKGITHILNTAGDACANYFPSDFQYLRFFLLDKTEEDIMSVLYDAIDFLGKTVKSGGKVLVHCHQGVSRSCVVIIAYLMLTQDMEFEECFQIVRANRKICRPNVGFMCQLLSWRKRCTGELGDRSFIYRVTPHCSRDRTRLVCRLVEKAEAAYLDSRAVFVVVFTDHVYIWVGMACEVADVFVREAKRHLTRLRAHENASANLTMVHQTSTRDTPEEKQFHGQVGDAGAKTRPEYDEDYTFTTRELEAIRGGYTGAPILCTPRNHQRTQSMALPSFSSFSSKRKDFSDTKLGVYNVDETSENDVTT